MINKKHTIIIGTVIGGIVLFGAGFAIGKHTIPKRDMSAFQTRQMPQGQFGTGNRMGGGVRQMSASNGGVRGEVIAKDATSITVKLPDGGSRIVLISGNTTVTKNTSGTMADISIGSSVVVSGSGNSDGSVTAQSINL